MRLNQGEVISQSPVSFYSQMTTHGLTMIGIWFVAGMVGVNYLMQCYVPAPLKSNIFALLLTTIGVVLLWVTTLVGKFHTGWTFLYPLPFKIAWAEWVTPLFLVSLAILGIGWLAWSVSMLKAIFKKYPITRALAWQHFTKNPSFETPPFVLITVVTLIGVITCLLAAVLLIGLFFAEYFSSGTFVNDPLLMKNLTYFFGHTIANEMLYLGLATLYELLPEISGRPKWKTAWYVALAWNCTLVFILTAFFHHMYMDFVQPEGFQIVGQVASYLASLPAVAVTVFSVLTLVYRNPIRWSLTNTLYFMGVAGWVIGGLGAVIDATIVNNFVLHNTLWVPAHFHTYNAMGNVLFSIAFFNWAANEFTGSTESSKANRLKIALLLIGGAGFLLMFYLGGAYSIPRRFNIYPRELSLAAPFARIAAGFATVYLVAVLIFFWSISRKCLKLLTYS
jgi:cytochrome c oxidase subunit 1